MQRLGEASSGNLCSSVRWLAGWPCWLTPELGLIYPGEPALRGGGGGASREVAT